MVQRCVKVIKRSALSEADVAIYLNEFKILTKLDHPNVCQLYEYFLENKRIYGVSELCNGGELYEEIAKRGRFTEKDAAIILK